MENKPPGQTDFVLIVGDASTQKSVLTFLQFYKISFNLFFTICGANDSETAINVLDTKLMQKKRCILIISDNKLHNGNGIFLFLRIKNSISLSQIPFLLLIGKFDRDTQQNIEKYKISWLSRPLYQDAFISKVSCLMGLQKEETKVRNVLVLSQDKERFSLIKNFLSMSGLDDYYKYRVVECLTTYDVYKCLTEKDREDSLMVIFDAEDFKENTFDFIREIKGDRDFGRLPILILADSMDLDDMELLKELSVSWSTYDITFFISCLSKLLNIEQL